jgi:nuclear pore complex protein Nup107
LTQQAYERALIRTLYEYVRTGQLDAALDLCRQSDQSWRAASLSGGRLWFDPSLADDEDDFEDVDIMDEELNAKRVRGNENRRLWKAMCRKIAASVSSNSSASSLIALNSQLSLG